MTLIREADHGTPASPLAETVTLTIDGQEVTVPAGTSIMRAASLMGTDIPKLCATDSLKSFGSCRICLVEIEGRAGTPASCTTPVAEGMVVHTQTERVGRLRQGVMELYLSDHPEGCRTCGTHGGCEIQDMAGEVGLRDVRYDHGGINHLASPIDDSNPYFAFDPAKCIVCSRCVRACDEIQGTFALTIAGRGFGSHVSASQERAVPGLRMRLLRRLRPGLPDRQPHRESRCSRSARPSIASSPPAPIAASAAPSRRRCAARSWCGWCRGRTARPIAATAASRAASPGAMPPTRSGSSSR